MRTLLINPPDLNCVDPSYDMPYHLLSLASYARDKGLEVDVLDMALNSNVKIPNDYDVYGLTSVTPVWSSAVAVKNHIRAINPNAKIIAGGKHVSAIPNDGIEFGFDAVFCGEAEVEFCKYLQSPKSGILQCNYVDISTLPPVDYSLIDVSSYAHRQFRGKKSNVVMASRGCEFSCAFCYNKGNMRMKPEESVIRDINHIGKDYAIFFCDDNFLSKKVYNKYVDTLKNYEWGCMGRAETLSNPLEAYNLLEHGLSWVHFGLESGSPKMLKNMSRTLNLKAFKSACENCSTCDIAVKISIIVGFPGETWETIKETEDFLKDIPHDSISVFPFIPFPGTPVFENPKNFGITSISSDWEDFRPGDKDGNPSFIYETNDLKKETISEMWHYLADKFSNSHVKSN